MGKRIKKLSLNRETVRDLTAEQLRSVRGGAATVICRERPNTRGCFGLNYPLDDGGPVSEGVSACMTLCQLEVQLRFAMIGG